jgi:hypothetical protein
MKRFYDTPVKAVFSVLVLALLVFAAVEYSTSSKRSAQTNPPVRPQITPTRASQSAPKNVPPSVTYLITGTTDKAAITYRNAQGGIEQKDITQLTQPNGFDRIPWNMTFEAAPGQFVSISAQNQRDKGIITCEVVVNGAQLITSTSEGAYKIASCSGSVPH